MRNDWTINEITIVLYEYCRKPFGQFSGTKQFVKDLALLLNRTPGAIVRKVGNLASFDPIMKSRGVGGLTHSSKMDKIVWNKYAGNWEQLAYDAEVLLAQLKGQNLEESLNINLDTLPEGKEKIFEVKKRINQSFFRDAVISSYNQKCCITGINNVNLLHASHIVAWSNDIVNRTNPSNGLCLNVLLHKAYDENLIGISPDYEILISDDFFGKKISDVDEATKKYIWGFNKKKIIMPTRFMPDKDLLAIHFEKYRQKMA